MIEAIIFDFDGVIVESAEIKTRAFQLLFQDYSDKLHSIILYHRQNMGISRYAKFYHIYHKILKQPFSKKIESGLGKKFSQIVVEEVVNSPFVAGALEFLEKNKGRYLFFVVSGTPQRELLDIIRRRRIGHFFKKIYGSPRDKLSCIKDVLSRYGLKNSETLFVGDALTDKEAAKKAGINFVVRLHSENKNYFKNCTLSIFSLNQLSEVLETVNKKA